MKERIKHIKLLFLVIISSYLVSCEGDLVPETFDKLSPENYPVNAEDARTLITGSYNILNQGVWGGYGAVGWQQRLIVNTATTDEFVCFWGHYAWTGYRNFQWTNSGEHTAGIYGNYIKGITKCINTMTTVANIAELNEDLKSRYVAEMHGVISLLAYTLYDTYGPVPIVVDPEITNDPETDYKPERPTKEWMVSFIEESARKAADDLPVSYSAGDYGRITKGTALMVLLKLAMHEGNWNEAVSISNEIIDLNYYALQANYRSVFSVENEMNNEIIFAIPQNVTDAGNVWLAHVYPGPYVSPDGIPIQKWGGYKIPWDMYDKFEEGNDDRLESVWRYINTANGIVDLKTIDEAWAKLGAIPAKYPEDPASTGMIHGNDYVVFRYADVLLLKAEALNRLNGPTQESIDLINEIRNRVNTTPIVLADYPTTEALNDYILDERFRELHHEGFRREDLIRHGKYISLAKERGAFNTDDNSRLLFPIPQSAIDENSNIVQNPGY